MKRIAFALSATAILFSETAFAEDCSKYPQGPFRFQCLSAKNPKAAVKLAQCKQEAANAGIREMQQGALRNSIQACMRR
jgi:hypothetical protein